MTVLFVANAFLILIWNIVAAALRNTRAALYETLGLQRAVFGVAFVTVLSIWMS